jgi:hypothetical protein
MEVRRVRHDEPSLRVDGLKNWPWCASDRAVRRLATDIVSTYEHLRDTISLRSGLSL